MTDGSPGRFLFGCLSFILGATLMKLAFYISEAPYGAQTWGWRCLYLGCGLCAVICLFFAVRTFRDLVIVHILHG